MRGFRAKDADRDHCVELIEAAYVDGQIGDADRELRVGRALSAETLDELQTLTRDLQLPPGAVASPPNNVPAPTGRPRRVAGVVVGLGFFIALVVAGVTGIVALLMFAVSGSETVTSQGVDVAPPPIASEAISEVDEDVPFRLTAAQVRTFVTAYEKQFATLEAYEVTFFPDRIQAQIPVRGSRPRMERWTWDGEWRQDTTAAAVIGPNQRVDAGAIDVRRMFANIDVAKRSLDVERARFTHAILHRWTDDPTELNIHVGNDFNESGYLSTTPAGEIARRHPYAS